MKKTLLLASLTLLALTLSGCDMIKKQVAQLVATDDDSTLVWETVTFNQNKDLGQDEDGEAAASITVNYEIAYPTNQNLAVADSIRTWILSHFDENTTTATPEEFPTLIENHGKKTMADFLDEVQEMYDPEEGYDFSSNRSDETQVTVTYEDNQYITLCLSGEIYLGGAHGMPYDQKTTFRKSDGRRMDWDLLADMSTSQIRSAIKKGLMDYFEVQTLSELKEELFVEDNQTFQNAFPLPTQPPYLTEEGVEVAYAPYEIACFAAGMPTAVVKKKYPPSDTLD